MQQPKSVKFEIVIFFFSSVAPDLKLENFLINFEPNFAFLDL